VASCRRAGSTSKKTPHDVDPFLQFGEAMLQVFDVLSHMGIVTAKIEIRKSKRGMAARRGPSFADKKICIETAPEQIPQPQL
jgi:hypothetical protein